MIEATVRRARLLVLTSLAAFLAFIPPTFSSFWGRWPARWSEGVAVGTLLTLLFLPALYTLWFGLKGTKEDTVTMRRYPTVIGAAD